jgi:chromosome segregation ATPase
MEHERESRNRDDRLAQTHETLRTTQDALRRAEIDLEVTKAAESRLIVQLGDAREEVKRQQSFAESVRRIEAGLSSRVEEEKAGLLQERDSLSRTLEVIRKQVADRTLVEDQRIQSLEEDLRAARARVDERTAELSVIKDELARERATALAAQERSAVLERQLSMAQERLSAAQGSHVMDSVVASETAERELAFERAKAEIESLTGRLAEAEAHAEQFRRIGGATEAALKELRERTTAAKEAQEAEVRVVHSIACIITCTHTHTALS